MLFRPFSTTCRVSVPVFGHLLTHATTPPTGLCRRHLLSSRPLHLLSSRPLHLPPLRGDAATAAAVEYEDDEADDMAAATDGGDAVARADELATSPSAGVPAEPTSPKIEQHGDSEAEEGDDVAAALHRRAAQRVEECEAEEAEDVAAAVDRSASVEEGMDELASSPCAGVAVPTSPKIEQHDEAFVDDDAIDGMAAVLHRRAAQRVEECEAEEGEEAAAADDRDASGSDEASGELASSPGGALA